MLVYHAIGSNEMGHIYTRISQGAIEYALYLLKQNAHEHQTLEDKKICGSEFSCGTFCESTPICLKWNMVIPVLVVHNRYVHRACVLCIFIELHISKFAYTEYKVQSTYPFRLESTTPIAYSLRRICTWKYKYMAQSQMKIIRAVVANIHYIIIYCESPSCVFRRREREGWGAWAPIRLHNHYYQPLLLLCFMLHDYCYIGKAKDQQLNKYLVPNQSRYINIIYVLCRSLQR